MATPIQHGGFPSPSPGRDSRRVCVFSHLVRGRPTRYVTLAAALLALAGTPGAASASPTQFSGNGANAAPALNAFKAAIGGADNGNAAGSQATGYRAINWDTVPDADAEPFALPGDYFNTTAPRGALLSTPGNSVRVSATGGHAQKYFADINSTYAGDFAAFSADRIFSPLGSNVTDVTFRTPAGTAPATVSGFGAIFVNPEATTAPGSSIEYFDPSGASLGRFAVPTGATSKTFSFLGELFSSEKVARVRITTGTAPLSATTDDTPPATNVVALDDFAYAEPQQLAGPRLAVTSPAEGSTVTTTRPMVVGNASDPYGLKSLTVDKQPVGVAPDGSWWTPVTLHSGRNAITVSATNTGGATTTLVRTITVAPVSNAFTIGRLKYAKSGTVLALVSLPGPGSVDLRLAGSRPLGHLAHIIRRASAGGQFRMRFKVPARARKLLKKKRYRANERVVFQPDGGDSATHTTAVTIGFRSKKR